MLYGYFYDDNNNRVLTTVPASKASKLVYVGNNTYAIRDKQHVVLIHVMEGIA